MSFKNRKDEGGSVLPLILALVVIAIIGFIVFLAIFAGILWFIEWLPANFGWVGVLLAGCAVSYLFYKYA